MTAAGENLRYYVDTYNQIRFLSFNSDEDFIQKDIASTFYVDPITGKGFVYGAKLPRREVREMHLLFAKNNPGEIFCALKNALFHRACIHASLGTAFLVLSVALCIIFQNPWYILCAFPSLYTYRECIRYWHINTCFAPNMAQLAQQTADMLLESPTSSNHTWSVWVNEEQYRWDLPQDFPNRKSYLKTAFQHVFAARKYSHISQTDIKSPGGKFSTLSGKDISAILGGTFNKRSSFRESGT
ncbi:MAG: hypothetical protein AAGF04_03870 [Chlamydiota bacterium]